MEQQDTIRIGLEISNIEEFKGQLKDIEETVDRIKDKFDEVVSKQKLLSEINQLEVK